MRISNQILFIVLVFFSLLNAGCKKDPLNDLELGSNQAVLRDGTAVGSGQPVTIEEAVAWFDNMADPTDFTVENFKLLSLDPAWLQSFSTNVGEIEGLLVPVFNDLDSIFPNSFYNLFFFRDSSTIVCRMVVFKSYNDISNAANVDMSTFKGLVFQISPDNHVAGFGVISAGKFVPLIIQDSIVSNVNITATYRDCPFCDWFVDQFNNCFDFSDFNWHGFWAKVDVFFLTTDWFENLGGPGWGDSFSGWNFTFGGYWNASGSNWFGSHWTIGGPGGVSSGPGTITNPNSFINVSALFSNAILNRAFRQLRQCQQVVSDDPDQNDSQFDNTNLALILANGNFNNPNNFYPLLLESIDKLLINASQNGNESFKSILEGVMSNYLPIGGNQGYVPQFLDPMEALFASKYIYEKTRATFELCSSNLNEMPASGEDLYEHGICNCMDNYSLTLCYNDFLKAYFSYNLGYTGEALNNRKYIASILKFFPNLENEISNKIAFIDCDINSSQFRNCVNEILLEYDSEALFTLGLAGQDWFYDDGYWSNPNLSFQSQELPSYQDFYDAFPKNSDGTWMYGSDNIYNLVGGEVMQARVDYPNETTNTCALKVSYALNGSGIIIPDLAGQTLEGSDGKFYFLNAKALCEWMKKTFINYEEYEDSEYSNPNIHTLLNGQKGIIISIYNVGGVTGHSNIYLGSGCASYPNCAVGGTVFWWNLN